MSSTCSSDNDEDIVAEQSIHSFSPQFGAVKQRRKTKNVTKMLIKTIADPHNTISKKEAARIHQTDEIPQQVFYSMNKQKRWDEITSTSLLQIADEKFDTTVMECEVQPRGPRQLYLPKKTVSKVHKLDTDGDSIKTVSYKGKRPEFDAVVKTAHADKRRSKKEEKKLMEDVDPEKAEDVPEDKPEVIYHLCKISEDKKRTKAFHNNQRCVYLFSWGIMPVVRNVSKWRRGHQLFDENDDEEDEIDEEEKEEEKEMEQENEEQNIRHSFSLGDFMADSVEVVKQKKKSKRSEGKSSDEEKEQATSEDKKKQVFELCDFSEAFTAPYAFDHVDISTKHWKKFNLTKDLEELQKDSSLTFRWLNTKKSRAMVDLSMKTTKCTDSYQAVSLIVIIEKTEMYRTIRVHVNSESDQQTEGCIFKSWKNCATLNNPTISALIEFILAKYNEWNRTTFFADVKKLPRKTGRENFAAAVHSSKFASTSSKLPESTFMSIMPEASDEFNDFEIVDISEIQEDEAAGVEIKCSRCVCKSPEDLYELKFGRLCRNCIHQSIISGLKTNKLPVMLPFVLPSGTTPLDVLHSVLSIPLARYYFEKASTAYLHQKLDNSSKIMCCPVCSRNSVYVQNKLDLNLCRCVGCGSTWCTSCQQEPHWPLSCEHNKDWQKKWIKQYEESSITSEDCTLILRIKCSNCRSGYYEGGNRMTSLSCSDCDRIINPQESIYLHHYHHYNRDSHWSYLKKYGRRDSVRCFDMNIIATRKIERGIKKEVAEICEAARSLRFNNTKRTDFERRVHKQGKSSNLVELRKAILYLVETGMAWLYMNKKLSQLKRVQISLLQMQAKIEQISDELQQKSSDNEPLTRRPSIEVLHEEAKELLKKNLAFFQQQIGDEVIDDKVICALFGVDV